MKSLKNLFKIFNKKEPVAQQLPEVKQPEPVEVPAKPVKQVKTTPTKTNDVSVKKRSNKK